MYKENLTTSIFKITHRIDFVKKRHMFRGDWCMEGFGILRNGMRTMRCISARCSQQLNSVIRKTEFEGKSRKGAIRGAVIYNEYLFLGPSESNIEKSSLLLKIR